VQVIVLDDSDADITESQNIASLHKQIAACDQILEVCQYLQLTL